MSNVVGTTAGFEQKKPAIIEHPLFSLFLQAKTLVAMREAELERASLLEGRLDQLKYETQQQEVRIFNRHPVF